MRQVLEPGFKIVEMRESETERKEEREKERESRESAGKTPVYSRVGLCNSQMWINQSSWRDGFGRDSAFIWALKLTRVAIKIKSHNLIRGNGGALVWSLRHTCCQYLCVPKASPSQFHFSVNKWNERVYALGRECVCVHVCAAEEKQKMLLAFLLMFTRPLIHYLPSAIPLHTPAPR